MFASSHADQKKAKQMSASVKEAIEQGSMPKALMEMLLAETGQRRLLVPVPWPVARMLGSVADFGSFLLPPPVTADQVESLTVDNVVSGQYPGLRDLGVTPTTLEAILPTYLYRYRKGGQYADQDAREMEAGRA